MTSVPPVRDALSQTVAQAPEESKEKHASVKTVSITHSKFESKIYSISKYGDLYVYLSQPGNQIQYLKNINQGQLDLPLSSLIKHHYQ